MKLSTALAFGKQPNSFDFDLEGTLIVAPTAVESDAVTLFLAIAQPHVENRVSGADQSFAQLTSELADFGCFATFKEGQVTELHVAAGLSAMTVSVYRQLGAALQLSTAKGGAVRYESLEYDGTGRYAAEYVREAPGILSKRKLRYLSILTKQSDLAAPALGNIVPKLLASAGRIELSPVGRPLVVRLADEMSIDGAQVPVHSKTQLALDAQPEMQGPAVRDWRAVNQKLDRLAADQPYVGEVSVDSLDAARIRGLTFDTILDRLKKLSATDKVRDPRNAAAMNETERAQEEVAANARSTLFVALAATFRRDQKAVAQAKKQIHTQPALASILIDALGSSGSSDAHQVLADLLSEKSGDAKVRMRALTALARTSKPSAVAVAALKSELGKDPFSTGALYGLGSYALYYRDAGDAAAAAALGEILIDRLRHADDVVFQLIVTLGGITNSGYAGAVDAVIPHLSDRRPAVRAAAVRAFQSMREPQVEPLIANIMTSDTETSVVMSAIAATSVREPSAQLAAALSNVALHSTDAGARHRSVSVMTDWKLKRPELLATLKEVATKDAEERVRELALSAL